jgi:hypothetical protein
MAGKLAAKSNPLPFFTGLQLSTSAVTVPIAICYGMPLIPFNLINAQNWGARNTGKKSTKGGKSTAAYIIDCIWAVGEGPRWEINLQLLGCGNQPDYGGTYDCSWFLRIDGKFFHNVYGNTSAGPNDVPPGTFDSFNFGPYVSGPPYALLSGASPPNFDMLPYKDTPIYLARAVSAGTTATIPQFEVLQACTLFGSTPLKGSADPDLGQPAPTTSDQEVQYTFGNYDADPALVIIDLNTHPRYGAGFPAEFMFGAAAGDPNLGLPGSWLSSATAWTYGDSALMTFCQAYGFGLSAKFDSQETMRDIVDRLSNNMTFDIVWDGRYLKVYPWNPGCVPQDMFIFNNAPDALLSVQIANEGSPPGPQPPGAPWYSWVEGALPKTYLPQSIPYFDWDDNFILQAKKNESPIGWSRVDPVDPPTIVRVTFKDRGNNRITNITESRDENYEDILGDIPRTFDIQASEEMTLGYMAQKAGDLILNRKQSVRNTGMCSVPWCFAMLGPCDLVTVTSTIQGLVRKPVRITKMTEKEDLTFDVEYEEFPIGYAPPAQNGLLTTPPPFLTQNTNNIPPSVFPPFIFEPTRLELAAEGAPGAVITVGASGGIADTLGSDWGGCQVWMSSDGGITYNQVGEITGPSPIGVLAAPLPTYGGTNPDTTDTLVVDMSMSEYELPLAVTTNQDVAGLCSIINASGSVELVSYADGAVGSGFTFNLTTLDRGLWSTASQVSGAGSQFLYRAGGNTASVPMLPAYVGTTLYFKLLSFNSFFTMIQSLSDAAAYPYVPTGVGF